MRYFQQFPTIDYATTEIVDGMTQRFMRTVPNMTMRFSVHPDAGSYEWYRITDRDRADTLAAQWYGSSEYTWVVMLSNNMRDLYDWPMDTLQFHTYMNLKYESSEGADDGVSVSQSTIYQYLWTDPISQQELVVDETFYDDEENVGDRRTLSVYDVEEAENDECRTIKRLLPDTFQSFVAQFTRLVGAQNA